MIKWIHMILLTAVVASLAWAVQIQTMTFQCLMLFKVTEYLDGTHKDEWTCKLMADSLVYALDVADNQRGMFNVSTSGVTRIEITGATLSGSRINVPSNATWMVITPPGAQLSSQAAIGSRDVVVLRVDGDDNQVTSSASEISDFVFNVDVNLVSQYNDCSYGQLTFVKTNNVMDGVEQIDLNADVDDQDTQTIENMVRTEAASSSNLGDLGQYEHIMVCLPPGTIKDLGEDDENDGWIGYGYFNDQWTVFNDDWCNYNSIQMHEIGHNMNLRHSGEDSSEYGDQTCLMGFSYSEDDTRMCFNGAKSWECGWYTERSETLDTTLDSSWVGQLIGVSDYDDGSVGEQFTVLLQILESNFPEVDKDLYLTYNRAEGINADVKEAPDMVTVVRGGEKTANNDGKSNLIAKLGAGDDFTVENFADSGRDLYISVIEVGSSGDTDYAFVCVSLDEVDCIILEQLDELCDKVEGIEDDLDDIHDKLDRLLCPFKDVIPFTVLRQGCDTVDQDCDEVVDECDEDNVPPNINLRVKVPETPFKSEGEAVDFLNCHLVVSDDCAVDLTTDIQLIDTDGCKLTFEVTVTDNRCSGQTPSATATKEFVLLVDESAPVVTCGFFTPQDEHHVSDDFDPCEGLPPPYPEAGDPLHIEDKYFNKPLVDVKLWYQIEDECPGNLAVDLNVRSNELQVTGTNSKMVQIFERSDIGLVHRAQVYLAPFSCQDHDGKEYEGICEEEETVTTRFYDISISATDSAGNVGQALCSVIVVPKKHYPYSYPRKRRPFCKYGEYITFGHDPNDLREEYATSVQRYEIASFSSVWDPNLDTTLVIPPLPPPKKHSEDLYHRNLLAAEHEWRKKCD